MRIFVTVGNALQPFDRMLRAVDGALSRHAGAFEGTCQHGTGEVRPHGLRAVKWLPQAEFESEMMTADVVVTHAGIGSVATALKHGHAPILFVRQGARGEHVNDHQAELLAELSSVGRVLSADTEDSLALMFDAFLRGEHRRHEGGGKVSPEVLRMIQAAIDARSARSAMARLRRAGLGLVASLGPNLRDLLVRGSSESER